MPRATIVLQSNNVCPEEAAAHVMRGDASQGVGGRAQNVN
jgi:hypothetical protein